MKNTIVIVAAACLVLCIFGMAMTRRDPAHCALCEAPESDVPCVLDLHSGEVAELRISTDELSDDPSTFTFSFMDVLGNTGYRDTGARMCKVTLPQDNLRLSPSYFCRDCRDKLQSVRKDHYAVLDTASKNVYPLQESSLTISEYSVTIAKEKSGMCVTVQSMLSSIERGNTAQISVFEAIAAFFSVSLDALVRNDVGKVIASLPKDVKFPSESEGMIDIFRKNSMWFYFMLSL